MVYVSIFSCNGILCIRICFIKFYEFVDILYNWLYPSFWYIDLYVRNELQIKRLMQFVFSIKESGTRLKKNSLD